jgi:hypothetical protein
MNKIEYETIVTDYNKSHKNNIHLIKQEQEHSQIPDNNNNNQHKQHHQQHNQNFYNVNLKYEPQIPRLEKQLHYQLT